MEKNNEKRESKVKGFFKGLAKKIDKALVEKGKAQSCCGPSRNSKGGGSCCS